jgi:hypothetical protein
MVPPMVHGNNAAESVLCEILKYLMNLQRRISTSFPFKGDDPVDLVVKIEHSRPVNHDCANVIGRATHQHIFELIAWQCVGVIESRPSRIRRRHGANVVGSIVSDADVKSAHFEPSIA